ncbi:MAG: GIY-YIG nuclease family protein [Pseudomonas sp.]|nr:GIY-YIG nuclease family protein [Pseudomonas sp.]MBQ0779005.1 GIY-YIG nuclease family protein [Pseudomonas sp.]
MPVPNSKHSPEHRAGHCAVNSAGGSEQTSAPPAAEKIWWVYMVRAANGHLYTGISTDPHRRLLQHQRGKGARFFNRSPAVALVWFERCIDHSDALRQERCVKALAKATKERLISQFNAELSIAASSCAASDARAKLDPL